MRQACKHQLAQHKAETHHGDEPYLDLGCVPLVIRQWILLLFLDWRGRLQHLRELLIVQTELEDRKSR